MSGMCRPEADDLPARDPGTGEGRGGHVWAAWVFLLAAAVFNDFMLVSFTYQGPSRTIRVLTVAGGGVCEVAAAARFLRLGGRYRHWWIPVLVIGLAALMMTVGLVTEFVVLLMTSPDNS